MLKVQKDESVHSLNYRTHSLNCINVFSNIINSKGHWKSIPKILKNTLHLYSPPDEHLFLHLLRELGLTPEQKIFEDPFSYRADLKQFFGQHEGSCRGQRKNIKLISYCLDCIQEIGFGYIKITWYLNSYCLRHKKPLYESSADSRKEAEENLKNIYRGKHPVNYKLPKIFNNRHIRWNVHRNILTKDLVAQCLTDKFKFFVLYQINKEEKPFKTILGKNYNSKVNVIKQYTLENIYKHIKFNRSLLLKGLLRKYVLEIEVFTGVFTKLSISEKIYKFKNSDCQRCLNYNCPANLKIIPRRSDNRQIEKCIINFLILMGYFENEELLDYNESRAKVFNMPIKDKMFILKNYQSKDSYHAYKTVIDNSNFAYAEPFWRWPKK